MKKYACISFVILLLILVPMVNCFAQEWSIGFELPGMGVGIGPQLLRNYDLIIKNYETRVYFFAGYYFDSPSWYGLGNKKPYTISTDSIITSLPMSNLYIKSIFSQLLFGDHYTLDYWYDVRLSTHSIFHLPMSSEPMYNSKYINGDEFSHTQCISFINEYHYSNDAQYRFLTYKGINIKVDLYLKGGSEFDGVWWPYLGADFDIDGYIPILNEYLYLQIGGNAGIISDTLNSGSDLPYYAYPELQVRGFSKTFRGFSSILTYIEIKSRFLELDDFDIIQNILPYMSFGVGIFGDAGFVQHPIDDVYEFNIYEHTLKSSVGAFIEYKINIIGLRLTTHIGATLFSEESGIFEFNPSFYFAII